MTAIFDENARQRLRQKQLDFEYHGQGVKNIYVKEIEKSLAREYIATFHYSQTFPDSTLHCYGAFIDEQLIGVVCYGMGCGKNQYISIIPNIENGQYCELTRLWVMYNAPKNSESRIISESLKLLPKDIKLVLSFADKGEGHCGIIYQATNWYYCGENNGGKMLLMPNGVKKHPRLLGVYRMRHPEYKQLTNEQLLNLLNFKIVGGGINIDMSF